MECAWKEFLALLPPWVRPEADRRRENLEEVRLRLGQTALLTGGDAPTRTEKTVSEADLQYVLNSACRYSPWTASTMGQGFVATAGGHRGGLCGQAVLRDGCMAGISPVRSLNIRVCRNFSGVSRNLWLRPGSVLILGPPGSGKTTLLRDLICQRSRREAISVVDERGELFPPNANFPMGENTDVMTGCGKASGMEAVLRTMSPGCIAVDEITAEADCRALLHAGWCGVQLLATAHASSVEDFRRRPVYAPLAQSGLFETAVVLQRDKSWHTERMVP